MAVAASPLSGARSPNSKALIPNVSNVILGNLHIKPWYPSAYPDDLVGKRIERLYVCQWCFRYTIEIIKYAAHCKVCPLKDEPPPGTVIYTKGDYEIREVDGEEHKLYAQNLSLFAKLFLETKSVFYDASTFLYYTLLLKDPTGDAPPASGNPGRVTAFFSKEKMSWDNNNLACILVFPPYQHRGLGQVLIAASYELGRREGRFGGPEKPLSGPGRRGYLHYWTRELARALLNAPRRTQIRIDDLSKTTWITPEDIIIALKEMEGVGERKTDGGSVVVNRTTLKAWIDSKGWDLNQSVVDRDAFVVHEEVGEDESEMEEP